MNLPISNVIRSLRRERNITQEELAAAVGVTYQSVSRWENGQAYPDMELIPMIAHFFNISTDILFGTDRESIEKKRDLHYQKIREVQNNPEEFYLACSAAYEEFPEEFSFGLWLCRCYIDIGVRPYEEHLDEIRMICRNILENCTNEDYRIEAMQAIIIVEDEELLESWLDKVPCWKSCREILLETRYRYRNDKEKSSMQRQENFISFLGYVFYNCVNRNELYEDADSLRLILRLIDVMRDTSVEIDAWTTMRADFHLRISGISFVEGERKEGYIELEKAIDLYVKYAKLPTDVELSYNCPILDLLKVNKQSNPEDDTDNKGEYVCWWAYHNLANPDGCFKCVHEEDLFKVQLERLLPYLPRM